MIRLQLDILPGGNIASKNPVAEINVALVDVNDETQNAEYKATLYHQNRSCHITGIGHNRIDGIWILMERVFKAIEENYRQSR